MKKYCEDLKKELATAKHWHEAYVKQMDLEDFRDLLTGPRHLKNSIRAILEESLDTIFMARVYWQEIKFVGQFDGAVRSQIVEKYIVEYKKRRFVFYGNLSLAGGRRCFLPDQFYVKGDLQLVNTPMYSLPKGLVVDGRIDIGNSKMLIPDDIQINGDFYATMHKFDDPRREQLKKLKARGQITGKVSILV